MKSNLPVTQREYSFGAAKTLSPVVDTQGRINDANVAFLRVGGWGRGGRQGPDHNIGRRPCLPPGAFADLGVPAPTVAAR